MKLHSWFNNIFANICFNWNFTNRMYLYVQYGQLIEENDSSAEFKNTNCQKWMKRCWRWRAKWALLKIWNSNQKSTFDWYCICTIKWNSYEFAQRVHVFMYARVCVVCVHGNQYRSPYRIFEFLISIRQFLVSHFPTAHTFVQFVERISIFMGFYAISCAFLIDFRCETYIFPRIVCAVPTKKRKETGDRKNNHTIQAEENGKRLSIFRTCRRGIMWWADELKTSE